VAGEAEKRGLPVFEATVNRQWDFADGKRIAAYLRAERFDVVHVHWSTDYVVTPWLAKRAGVPAVLMSRHSPYPLKSALGRYLYDRVLFDRVIALSESVRQTLVGQGLRPEHVVTIHHGTDTDAFRAVTRDPAAVRAEWGVAPSDFLVGLTGRIAEEKGWRVFLEAVSRLPDVRAVLVGDGPEGEAARARATELGVADRVTFAGFRSDINDAINALDVLVLASTWAEPCAAVVQQAMALGKPVVGTDTGGTPEMVDRDRTGLIVPPGDAGALADALNRLANDPALRARMGAAGQSRADELFTLRRMVDRNESLYREILAARR
jgi:glycosyltransferase involved in cell wall biosynthesis